MITKSYEINENENTYIVNEYENGTIEKVLKVSINTTPPTETENTLPTLEDKINYLYYRDLGVI